MILMVLIFLILKSVKNTFRSPMLDKSFVKGGRAILEVAFCGIRGLGGGEWKTSAVVPATD